MSDYFVVNSREQLTIQLGELTSGLICDRLINGEPFDLGRAAANHCVLSGEQEQATFSDEQIREIWSTQTLMTRANDARDEESEPKAGLKLFTLDRKVRLNFGVRLLVMS